MAKSIWTAAASWSTAATILLSTIAPEGANAARFSFGGGFHGSRGGGFGGFRQGIGDGAQRGFGNSRGGGCPIGAVCRGGNNEGPHWGGFGQGPHWGGYGSWPGPHLGGLGPQNFGGGYGPSPYGGGFNPGPPPDDPSDGGSGGPTVAASQGSGSGSSATLATGERLVSEFSEAARLALGRCPAVRWSSDGAPLDEASTKRLHCVGDVLSTYADKLEEVAPILPQRMRSLPVLLKATAKKVRSAKTKAEAVAALAAATGEVRKTIALLKADDPAVRSIGVRESGQIAQTLNVAEEKLEKAVGL
jgi:hypothetical protein